VIDPLNCRQHVEFRFDLAQMAEAHFTAYEQILGHRRLSHVHAGYPAAELAGAAAAF